MPPGNSGEAPAPSPPSRPSSPTAPSNARNYFEIPAPIKRVFNRFPLVTYPANELPLRAPRARTRHGLYVFKVKGSSPEGASCNPSCLKWQVSLQRGIRGEPIADMLDFPSQTYLKLLNIPFIAVSSNNHASPSGTLPFLLPVSSSKSPTNQRLAPIPTNKLLRWSRGQAKTTNETTDIRFEAYQSLLDIRIRKAWVNSFSKPLIRLQAKLSIPQLYHLYLCPPNFSSVAVPCYIQPASGNPLVGAALAIELRSAASAEILRSSPALASGSSQVVDAEALYTEAEDAFLALSTLLKDDEWFFGVEQPELMDASVFAYTHLLLDDALGWSDKRLNDGLRKYDNLVRHRARILEGYY